MSLPVDHAVGVGVYAFRAARLLSRQETLASWRVGGRCDGVLALTLVGVQYAGGRLFQAQSVASRAD
jgi:hypothetical protein